MKYDSKSHNYQQVEYEYQRLTSLLQRMPILEWKMENFTMDFVVGLRKAFEKHDLIWVIVDKLIKLTHFISVRVEYNSKKLSKIYVKEIVRLHGVLRSIISDRDTTYTYKFWDRLHEELGTKLLLAHILSPIDGQSERMIQVLVNI